MPIGDREPRADKVQAVAELKDTLNVSALILTDFKGLNVKSISELRKKLRESGSGYVIVKNTLFRLAAAGTPAEPLSDGLAGQTAIVYTNDDPVAAAKVLQEFTKVAKTLKVKSGLVDGHIMNADQMKELASIPPKQQLYAMVVGGLQGPIYNLVGSLQSMMGQLVMTLQAVSEKKAAA